MNIVPLHTIPCKKEAEKIIRALTENNKVSFSLHCKERMKERGINMPQILNCLAKGRAMENPTIANKKGDMGGYEITMEKLTAGEYIKVVVCLRYCQTALVITAMKVK